MKLVPNLSKAKSLSDLRCSTAHITPIGQIAPVKSSHKPINFHGTEKVWHKHFGHKRDPHLLKRGHSQKPWQLDAYAAPLKTGQRVSITGEWPHQSGDTGSRLSPKSGLTFSSIAGIGADPADVIRGIQEIIVLCVARRTAKHLIFAMTYRKLKIPVYKEPIGPVRLESGCTPAYLSKVDAWYASRKAV